MEKIIFLGNGVLAETALEVLKKSFEVVFHARTKEDLKEVVKIRQENPRVRAVLASFGVLVPEGVLEVFEPEGILNIHPSLLPEYRGPSPIETAILDGKTEFGVSVMKLAKEMDAGPVYWQGVVSGLLLEKETIYRGLAEAGASWIVENLAKITDLEPKKQVGKASYTRKLERKDGILEPELESTGAVFRKIIAFQGFPKAKYAFFGVNTAILEARVLKVGETAPLTIKCQDGGIIEVLKLQPDGKKPMDTKSFLNGYKRK